MEADLDSLSEEAFSYDLSMDEITRAEDAMRAATGGSQGFRAPDVPCNKMHVFWGIWTG